MQSYLVYQTLNIQHSVVWGSHWGGGTRGGVNLKGSCATMGYEVMYTFMGYYSFVKDILSYMPIVFYNLGSNVIYFIIIV